MGVSLILVVVAANIVLMLPPYFFLMAILTGELGSACSTVDSPYLFWKRASVDGESVFLQAACPSHHQTVSFKEPKRAQSTDPK